MDQPVTWIDSHAHIYSSEFEADREDVLQAATELGVNKIMMPNVDHTSIDSMMEVEAKHPKLCFAMMGLHPCSVKKDFEKELYRVEEWLSKRKFLAVGEIGTDLYWDKTFWEQQQEAFVIQVKWAKQHKLPIVIHSRESLDETVQLLEPFVDEQLTGVFHCFSGSIEQAKKITSLGFYLGLGGVSTFKNSGMDAVIPQLELDNIILETDCPYLAPVPHRGKRNEPGYIPLIASKICELKKVSHAELSSITVRNTNKLFRLS